MSSPMSRSSWPSQKWEVRALRCALTEIVRRHASVRPGFISAEGQPWQIGARSAAVSVRVVDLTALPETSREPAGVRLMVNDTQRPFDLKRGPLVRVQL